ncbi:hypothetical protein Pla86_02030 [Planctomycetes bacterium Pla86]|uniref:Uncharacterized protein n=2 Tax=Engelhardtia mirabilis TaxID=2528011 RepID=A0A518BDS4_9BACT|nr:hypothetical protein Pla133_02030 [Planctomycetes bacterium Pla133]QDU99465.1 hypothetical protein Pla86_02030 [Planctomycetes bacterium Pla86]
MLVGAGGDPSRPQTVARGFGLDKNLAWKVSRLVESDNDVEALRFLPGPAGRRMLCEAIGARGTEEARARVEQALSAFDLMVDRHAGDRATLDVLAQCLDPAHVDDEVLQQHRKQAFLGNRATWGAQTSTQIAALIAAPGQTADESLVALELGGLLGFRCIRSDVRWCLLDRSAESNLDEPRREPLVPPPAEMGGAPLLAEFCSQPLPEVESEGTGTNQRYLLRGRDVGLAGQVDCVYGQRATYGPRAAARGLQLRVPVSTPEEDFEFVALLHRDLVHQTEPVLDVVGLLTGAPVGLDLMLPISVDRVEGGLAALRVKRAPMLAGLLRHSIRAEGWNPDDFVAWHFSVPFPPIPSAVRLALRGTGAARD